MPTTYAIPDGRTVMAATLYTGNGSTQSISNAVNGVSFQPDFVWYKNRSIVASHNLFDSVRGVNKYLISDSTAAEGTASGVTAFNSNGFSVGSLSNGNGNGNAIVGWQWNAGGSTVTNTSGSISAQVRANATAGFSVVTYTGTGANATVGHGLGVAPRMIIIKSRTFVSDWVVYHASIGNTGAVFLDLTNATSTSSLYFQNTSPTSSVFSIGIAGGVNNSSSDTYVAYCFAAVAGYSAFGSYTGNGSADGPFVYLNFRPRFVMIKRTDVANAWMMYDTARNTDNVVNKYLFANAADAENTGSGSSDLVDFLSNGFKLRCTTLAENASGGTYVYAAFAESPFKFSNAR